MAVAVLVGLVGLVGCGPAPTASTSDVPVTLGGIEAIAMAITGGMAAPELTGVVTVSHVAVNRLCSGTLVADDLVVTAAHCVLEANAQEDGLHRGLAADGFIVQFGADAQGFERRGVIKVDYLGAPAALEPQEVANAGADTAVLTLKQAAPEGAQRHGVRFLYSPQIGDRLTIAGFGLTDLNTGTSGVRHAGHALPVELGANGGVVALDGAAVCLGDSGGPLLFGPRHELVGVLSQAHESPDGGLCAEGRSYASTFALPEVASMLRGACAARGGCGPQRVDAGVPLHSGLPLDGGLLDGARADGAVGATLGWDASVIVDGSTRLKSVTATGGCSMGLRSPARPWFGLVLAATGWLWNRRQRIASFSNHRARD